MAYFSSSGYYFQFSDHNINTNDFNDTLGHFTIQLADITWGARLPLEGVNN
jgi:hypothetical protein